MALQQYPQGYGYSQNVPPQYPAPYQQHIYGTQTHAAPHVLRHQAAYDQLSRLQIEHQNLAEHVKKEARRHRKVEAKQASVLESVVQEKHSVVAQNKDLKKKLKRQSRQIEEEQRRGRSRRRSEVEMDELTRIQLSYAERAFEADRLNQHLAELQARQEEYGYRDHRDRDKGRELRKKLEKRREKVQEQEAKIAELKRERSRARLKQSREQKTAAWAEDQERAERERLYMEDLRRRDYEAGYAEYPAHDWKNHFRPRRAQSQSNRYAPPTAYAYQSSGRLRSYSLDTRVPPPPPPPSRHHSRHPPPPAQLRSSLYAAKPHRSKRANGSEPSSHGSGIGGSSTSTSQRRHANRKGNSSGSNFEASTVSSTVSSNSRMGRSFSLSEARGGKRRSSSQFVRPLKDWGKPKKAYVETDHEDERDVKRRSHSPFVYIYDEKIRGKKDDKEYKKNQGKKKSGSGKYYYQ